MPKAFDECVAKGGKVRTITLPDNKYRKVCTLNGKSVYGEVKTKATTKSTAPEGEQREGDLATFSAPAKTDVDKEDRTMVATLTTSDIDHGGTVIFADGIKLDVYRKNPIVLWSHMSFMPPIGVNQWIKKTKEGKALVGKTKFAKRPDNHEGQWMPDVVMDLYQQDVLKGVSVGLRVDKARYRADSEEEEKWFKENKVDKKAWRVIEKATLVEYSCCSIPMNPNALKEALDDGLDIPDHIANVLGFQMEINDDGYTFNEEVEPVVTENTLGLDIEFVMEELPEPEPVHVNMTSNDVVNAAKALGANNRLAEDIAGALKIDSVVKVEIDKVFGRV